MNGDITLRDTLISPIGVVMKNISVKQIFTLRAKLSGAVYCHRSCLCICNERAGGRAACVCVSVGLLP